MGRFRKTATVVAALFVVGCILKTGEESGSPAVTSLAPERDTVTASINIRSGMYTRKGFLTGFQYTMLTGFADTSRLKIGFSGVYEHRDNWQMLVDGLIDIIALDATDTVPPEYTGKVAFTMPFRGYVWLVRKDDFALHYQLDRWLGTMVHSSIYRDMEERFFRSYDLAAYIDAGMMTDRISPYDEVIKQQSRILGWDWKLLSAVVFKESRFSVGASSRRGAVGLMQVKRSTAAEFGIEDLFNPGENVKAGAMFLRQIQRAYQNKGLDSVNVLKFTLAAYNAGESRIEDCIAFTRSIGRDCTDWESVAAAIPLMSDRKYAEEVAMLRHGVFKGDETVQYVKDVLSKYREYLAVIKE